MVYYKDGVPTADAQILTGNPNVPNCSTPVGCYSTGEKISGYTVPGEDYPGSVNYWIPFGGGLGINDAPWRTEFGGQIYDFEGTHGYLCTGRSGSDHLQCSGEKYSGYHLWIVVILAQSYYNNGMCYKEE